jgi:secreted Zn-dependent insulinase-like peptidase
MSEKPTAVEREPKVLHLDAGTLVFNYFLLLQEKGEYKNITLEELDELLDCIYKQLTDSDEIKNYDDVILNVNKEYVEKTVYFNNELLDLIGDTIILHSDEIPNDIVERYKTDKPVVEAITQFIDIRERV